MTYRLLFGREAAVQMRLDFISVEKLVHVHDLHATVLHLLGFGHKKLTYRYSGRDYRMTDVEGNVMKEILV